MGLLELDNNALVCVLCQLNSPQDLLRLGRACSRLHGLVQHHAEPTWQQLYQHTYPHKPRQPISSYKAAFQDRWVRDAKELRLQRKVQRMRLQSDAAQLQRELHQMQGQLQAERRLQTSLEQQLRQTHRAKLASGANGSGHWQLGAVQLYHNRVVQAAPVRLEAKLADLQQQQKVSRLQLQTLKSSIDMRRQRLSETKRRLAALEG